MTLIQRLYKLSYAWNIAIKLVPIFSLKEAKNFLVCVSYRVSKMTPTALNAILKFFNMWRIGQAMRNGCA